jgi:putative ABC transport system permease protein
MTRLGDAVYALLLRAFPARFRRRHGAEMLAEFRRQRATVRRRPLAITALWTRATVDALRHGFALRFERPRAPRSINLWQDVRFGLRGLARNPGHVAVSVLGLGVGLTVAIVGLSVVQTLFRGEPIGTKDRETLARVAVRFRDGRGGPSSATLDEFRLFRGATPSIRDLAALRVAKVTVRVADDMLSVPGAFVSDTFFQVLGTQAVAGRLLTPADDRPDSSVVVLGHRIWQRWFAGSPAALGQSIIVAGRPVQIVGVAPEGFTGRGSWISQGPDDVPQVWLSTAIAPDVPLWSALQVTARLTPGSTRQRARADLLAVVRAVESANAGGRAVDIRVRDFVLGDTADNPIDLAGLVATLMVVPVLLLLLSCANVANLRLARATSQARDLSLRIALGASRTQVARLLLAEAWALAGLALLASWIGTHLLLWQLGPTLLQIPVRVAPVVIAGSLGLALFVILLTGLAPALLVTRRAMAFGLKEAAHTGGVTHTRLRRSLVVAQVAVSVSLLTVGSLLIRSAHYRQAEIHNPGPVVVADLDLESQGYDQARAAAFAATLLATFEGDTRFSSVGLSAFPFLRGRYANLAPLGGPPGQRAVFVSRQTVTPGWFKAVGLDVSSGRIGRAHGAPEIVVSDSVAGALAATGNPVGMSVAVSSPEWPRLVAEIVGVVPDLTPSSEASVAQVYFPLRLAGDTPLNFTLFARAADQISASALVPDVNRAIAAIAPTMPWIKVQTTSDVLYERTRDSRLLALFVSGAGSLALILAAAGIFAVMSYTVTLRQREIAIRMAIGGGPVHAVRLVIAYAMRLTATGTVLGLGAALPLAFLLRSALLGLSPLDPLALAGSIGVLFAASVAASLIPALRAAATSPLVALRAEQ